MNINIENEMPDKYKDTNMVKSVFIELCIIFIILNLNILLNHFIINTDFKQQTHNNINSKNKLPSNFKNTN